MPDPAKGFKQKAVLWAFSDYDEEGRATVAAAVQKSVRWEDKQVEILGPEETPIAISAVVFVDFSVQSGSIMWKGKLADLPSPLTSTGMMEVVSYEEVPDIKGKKPTRKLYLRATKSVPILAS